ncbi:MAG: hypothetical protein RMJ16_14105 [Thermoguttaceae bacterium]|nr:hypothetical protein [Thermoguttaceae bacterium]
MNQPEYQHDYGATCAGEISLPKKEPQKREAAMRMIARNAWRIFGQSAHWWL